MDNFFPADPYPGRAARESTLSLYAGTSPHTISSSSTATCDCISIGQEQISGMKVCNDQFIWCSPIFTWRKRKRHVAKNEWKCTLLERIGVSCVKCSWVYMLWNITQQLHPKLKVQHAILYNTYKTNNSILYHFESKRYQGHIQRGCRGARVPATPAGPMEPPPPHPRKKKRWEVGAAEAVWWLEVEEDTRLGQTTQWM